MSRPSIMEDAGTRITTLSIELVFDAIVKSHDEVSYTRFEK